jgi:outer membrane protein insertion porin family
MLAAQVLTAMLVPAAGLMGAGLAAASEPAALTALVLQGGGEDDQAYARVAAGLLEGAPLGEADFQTALAAIRATDRFRTVDGRLLAAVAGRRAEIRLDPWPKLESVIWQAPLPKAFLKTLPPGLRTGARVGDLKLEAWRRQAQIRLREGGYPEGRVAVARSAQDRALTLTVTPGRPTLVRQVEVAGPFAPYSAAKLISIARIKAGQTLWTELFQRSAEQLLRQRFQKDKRFEARADFSWDGQGNLRLDVSAGPVVRLKAIGDSLGWTTQLKDMVPVARANRYSPELLDEGSRRIVRFMRGKGYLEAQVTYTREVLGDGTVLVTYTLRRGELTRLQGVRFEGNVELPEQDLIKAAGVSAGLFSPGGAKATPDLMDAAEARVKAHYQALGFTEVSLRLLPLERRDGVTRLVYRVHEGPRRLVRWLKLDLPPGGFGDPWGLGECLTLLFSDRARRLPSTDDIRRYGSDRPAQAGVQGSLTCVPDPARAGALTLTLALDQPIPLLKSDLARVFTAIRGQRLPALGVARPVVRLKVEALADGSGIFLEVPAQTRSQVERLVVQGSERTRARAVLRETRLKPGTPLDLDAISRSQARLSYLGAFQRVDLTSLAEDAAEAGQDGPPNPWKDGDLLLRLEERPPWVVTSSFGYDKSQGYHVGAGVQRLNFGGMGRTVDFGVRAGDGTIKSDRLKKIFSTGTYDRSVDAFTLGYSDPWFAPPLLEAWLPERTLFRTEAAYIQERRSLYLLRRRRLLSSIQWSPDPQVSFQLGYRFERVEVQPAVDNIDGDVLAITARYPPRAIISAPFVQIARDTRDNAFDPTSGSYSVARLELANQLFLTSPSNSFVKLDVRQQWTWPIGYKAGNGVVSLGLRLGLAKPTAKSAENLPLSERFFAGGPFTYRGAEPDGLGPQTQIPLRDTHSPYAPLTNKDGSPITQATALGGQAMALVNLEYRFPLIGQSVWGEVFLDSGQVYESLARHVTVGDASVVAKFPPLRTALGIGLILKIGVPLKVEYAADLNRILGKTRSQEEKDSQLKGLLISAGFQF